MVAELSSSLRDFPWNCEPLLVFYLYFESRRKEQLKAQASAVMDEAARELAELEREDPMKQRRLRTTFEGWIEERDEWTEISDSSAIWRIRLYPPTRVIYQESNKG